MANLNHNRPHLRMVDNLRRVLAAADSCYVSSHPPIEAKPARNSKECVTIAFRENELDLCKALLDSIELYFNDFEIFLKGLMPKSKSKTSSKSKLIQSESNLRTNLREFFTEYMLVQIKKAENSGLPAFWKLLQKELKKGGCVHDIVVEEVANLNEAITSGSLDQRLTQTSDRQLSTLTT